MLYSFCFLDEGWYVDLEGGHWLPFWFLLHNELLREFLVLLLPFFLIRGLWCGATYLLGRSSRNETYHFARSGLVWQIWNGLSASFVLHNSRCARLQLFGASVRLHSVLEVFRMDLTWYLDNAITVNFS
jgi:hypothetical protein